MDIRARLHEFGVALETEPVDATLLASRVDAGIDAFGTLSRGASRARYAIIVKESMTISSVAQNQFHMIPYPVLVIGDRISRRSAVALRDAGIQFADTLGNTFVEFDNVLIDVQGRSD